MCRVIYSLRLIKLRLMEYIQEFENVDQSD
nr:MAG TPA: hypothetical protein [Crassvirales sp.]DAO31245.1 MAG TPA: hypothetical protein [Crassvirales sp.]